MPEATSSTAGSLSSVIRHALADNETETYVIAPPPDLITALADAAGPGHQLRILLHKADLDAAMNSFVDKAKFSELARTEAVSVREVQHRPYPCVARDEFVGSVLTNGEWAGSLETTDPAFCEQVLEWAASIWQEGTPLQLRTPPLSRVKTTLEDDFDAQVADDYIEVMKAAAEHNAGDLDEMYYALLVGAKHRLIQYDLGHWARDCRLCSRASLSRKKCHMEESGLIGSESVQEGLGRPRHRLRLDDAELADCNPDEFVATAASKFYR